MTGRLRVGPNSRARGLSSITCVLIAFACGGTATSGNTSGVSGADGAERVPPTPCQLNSDCHNAQVCVFGACRAECTASRDCPAGERCVVTYADSGSSSPVCQLQQEAVCHYGSDCKAPLVCARDLQCRNECRTERDCASGQRCSLGVCGENNDFNPNGMLKGAVDAGTSVTPVPSKCTLNSECAPGLVCSFGLCHRECETSLDCAAQQRCIAKAVPSTGTAAGVCQLQPEAACVFNSDCPDPLICAADMRCRNQCVADRDCITRQRCASGSCAEPSEINPDGSLKGSAPPVAGGADASP